MHEAEIRRRIMVLGKLREKMFARATSQWKNSEHSNM
jgi:hypothetical protein